MPLNQKLFAIVISICVLIFIIEMVRRKKLREEYSVLWLGTSVTMLILVIKYDWLVGLTDLIGAALPTTTLFLGSIIFLMLLDQVKNLAQENALLRQSVESAEINKSKL